MEYAACAANVPYVPGRRMQLMTAAHITEDELYRFETLAIKNSEEREFLTYCQIVISAWSNSPSLSPSPSLKVTKPDNLNCSKERKKHKPV